MPINYGPTKPVAGASRATAPTEVDRWSDYADTIGDVDTRIAAKVSKAGGDTITASGAAVIPLVVKGAASQTANLLEAQNSAGTVLASVNSGGGVAMFQGYVGADPGSAAQLRVGTTAASNRGLIVRGAASQTANLAEFQVSSGTVVASVDANGAGYFNLAGSNKKLEVGNVDSAGTGYRTVRVAN